MKKVSIIIPAYNEEKRIAKTLKDYINFFKKFEKKREVFFEIIVVLNACTDNTLEVVNKVKKELKEKNLIILNFRQAGKGFAIIQGFKDALKRDSDLIGFIDADGATPPEAFYDLIKNIGNNGGIIANRWDKKSKIRVKQSLLRRIMSRGYNFIVRSLFLFPYRDTQCGAKVFKREALEKILPKLGESEWGFDVELLFHAKKVGVKIKSIPTIWFDQKESKINIKKTPVKMFLSAIRLRLLHSPFKFILRAWGRIPLGSKIYAYLKK